MKTIDLNLPEKVLDICSSLVMKYEYQPFDSIFSGNPILTAVRLAHSSVREYLISKEIRTSPAAFFKIEEEASHRVIAGTCLSCLRLIESPAKLTSLTHPLFEYSAEHCTSHLFPC